ncbi:hypothetical protein Q4555_07990 [Octadecabacter sp. 1_MG-2023]|uniref:hypothetical protein n=1 Tax=unclassified Octadecabacter TaxID=196158 RepID=UPI001C086194|nr:MULTISPECIES: hypothetical protein [unclassified Octadecabacter]MBU2992637.1 hypothetical protein [Octadecabacter sp. B2R22]MDO6734606.1 hypothetical protein [Octadecabacter sp. 1_MG-2023]
MRIFVALIGLIVLTACGGIRDDLTETPDPIGTFRLGHNIAVVNEPVLGPFSRTITDDEWQAAMVAAVDDRFGEARYFGDKYFHIGVAVEAYVLAYPGVPLVYSPKSVLIFSVNFFEDSTQTKLNDEAIQITVFEPCCTIPLLGSGFTRDAEEQMEGLSFNAARAIERTMRENADWFGGVPEVLEEDATIIQGNVLEDNPELIAPEQEPPADLVVN